MKKIGLKLDWVSNMPLGKGLAPLLSTEHRMLSCQNCRNSTMSPSNLEDRCRLETMLCPTEIHQVHFEHS